MPDMEAFYTLSVVSARLGAVFEQGEEFDRESTISRLNENAAYVQQQLKDTDWGKCHL